MVSSSPPSPREDAVPAEHGQIFRPAENISFKSAELVAPAPGRSVFIQKIICQGFRIRPVQRIGVFDRDKEAFLQRRRPLTAFYLGKCVPALKKSDDVFAVICGAADVIVLVCYARCRVRLRKCYVFPAFYGAVLVKYCHAGAGSRFYGKLGPSVPVKIVDDKLGVMCARPDINAQIKTP